MTSRIIRDQLTKMSQKKTKNLQTISISFIIDITLSMERSLQSVKKAISQTAASIEKSKLKSNVNLMFEFLTFSESQWQSYAKYKQFDNIVDAKHYVQTLRVGIPKKNGTLTTSISQDREENLKYALAKFHFEHDFFNPSIVFFITDTTPHRTEFDSDTAAREVEALDELNYPRDFFEI